MVIDRTPKTSNLVGYLDKHMALDSKILKDGS